MESRLVGIRLVLAVVFLGTLTSCTASQSSQSVTIGALCGLINGTLFYPTVPASGEHISAQAAARIEQLLEKASDSRLRQQAAPLRSAINAHYESGMLQIVSSVQTKICAPSGYPPAT